jgi:hypothetical protein
MKKVLLVFLLTGLSLIGQASLLAQNTTPSPIPSLTDLKDTWTQLDPGGETICSKGTPFKFFAHPGQSNKLLIYFDGGGACWNDETCAAQQGLPYTPAITVTAETITNGYGGIFDLDNAENPFADYSMVFVPYCTGDMHMGDNVVTYGTGEQAVEIHHKGHVNDQAALNWVYDNFEAPEHIFVTGISAGSPGAIFNAPFIMEHYQGIPVTELGDSGGGWRAAKGELAEEFTAWGTGNILPDWVEGFEGITPETFSFEKLYTAAAAQYPDHMFAEFNTAHDQVQNSYVSTMIRIAAFYDQTLPASLKDISGAAPNFRYFTAGGSRHGIIGGNEFYTYAVDGLRFRDWLNDLVNGKPVENVQCKRCAMPEVVEAGG